MPASTQTGMGARPYPGGVGFRVWAKFARGVAVAGDFNGWSGTQNPLTSEGNGYWSADVPGAQVGQRYKYVIVPPGGPPAPAPVWRNDPYAREMTTHDGVTDSLVHEKDFDWQGDAFELSPWNEIVLYELHVGTFNDAYADGPGRFQGVIDKLPYLRDLGVNAILVMAAGEFKADFSWGYNPAYLFAIEEAYGGLLFFKTLIREAHRHGIGVIFDVVYNHLGDPAEDMWRFDGWAPDAEHGGIYFYSDWRSWTPWGEYNRPDYGRDEVRQYLRDNAVGWLDARRVDGLRWDSSVFTRSVYGRNDDPGSDLPAGWSLMQWVNDEKNRLNSRKLNMAEDLQNNPWLTRGAGADGARFDTQWDAAFVYPVREELARPDDGARDVGKIRAALEQRYNNDVFERVIYVESHDEVSLEADSKRRLPDLIRPGGATGWFARKRALLGAVLTFTAPGIPMLFQGQEWLEWERFDDDRPLDWGRAGANPGAVALFRDLARLRRNWFDNTRGLRGQYVNVFHSGPDDKVVAFHRWDAGGPRDDVVVVVNLADRGYDRYRIGMPRAGRWRVRFNSDSRLYAGDFGDRAGYDTTANDGWVQGMPCHADVGIGPYSALILSQDG